MICSHKSLAPNIFGPECVYDTYMSRKMQKSWMNWNVTDTWHIVNIVLTGYVPLRSSKWVRVTKVVADHKSEFSGY